MNSCRERLSALNGPSDRTPAAAAFCSKWADCDHCSYKIVCLATSRIYVILTSHKTFTVRVECRIHSLTRLLSDWEDYTVFRNACIDADVTSQQGFSPTNVYIKTFDQVEPVVVSSFLVQQHDSDHPYLYQWLVANSHSGAPQAAHFATEIAIFTGYFADYMNLYKVMYFLPPVAYDALVFVDEKFEPTAKHLPKNYVIPAATKHIPWHWFDMILGVGYTQVKHASYFAISKTQRCFEIAVFQTVNISRKTFGIHGGVRTSTALKRVDNHMQTTTKHQCTSNYTLFIQREGTRRILNIDELMTTATSYGYKDVKRVYFENKTFAEQWKLIHCANVYIGVHGAALIWFTFLPPNATFVELVFDGWHTMDSHYSRKYRRDVSTRVFRCERVTPVKVWRHYAQLWFNYSGVIDESWIQRLNVRSAEVKSRDRAAFTPWKDSNVRCSPHRLFDMLARQSLAVAQATSSYLLLIGLYIYADVTS